MLFLDVTSKSEVYNPLSPQGQWLYHRFGKRNFPKGEIDFIELLNYLKNNHTDSILCYSYFGDPLFYSNIIPLAKYCSENQINLMIFTYGNFQSKTEIKKLLSFNVKIFVFLSGYEKNNSLLYHNASWKNFLFIKDNIAPENLFLEYSLYKHNLIDLQEIIKIVDGKTNLKVNHGNLLGSDFASIISETSEWLYDFEQSNINLDNYNLTEFNEINNIKDQINNLMESDNEANKLIKSSRGFLYLRTCLNERNFDNIFNTKLENLDLNNFFEDEEDIYINYLGYVFKNKDLFETFNNSLCDDWSYYIKNDMASVDLKQLAKNIILFNKTKNNKTLKNHVSKVEQEANRWIYEYKNLLMLSFLSNSDLDNFKLSKQF